MLPERLQPIKLWGAKKQTEIDFPFRRTLFLATWQRVTFGCNSTAFESQALHHKMSRVSKTVTPLAPLRATV